MGVCVHLPVYVPVCIPGGWGRWPGPARKKRSAGRGLPEKKRSAGRGVPWQALAYSMGPTPFVMSDGESNPRPGVYQTAALTTEPLARFVSSEPPSTCVPPASAFDPPVRSVGALCWGWGQLCEHRKRLLQPVAGRDHHHPRIQSAVRGRTPPPKDPPPVYLRMHRVHTHAPVRAPLRTYPHLPPFPPRPRSSTGASGPGVHRRW